SAAARNEIAAVKTKLAKYPTYAAWRRLAELYLANAQYSDAVAAYRAQSQMYRAKGLLDAALIQENNAANYDTTLNFYHEREATPRELDTLYTGATLEPFVGCYVGAFIDRDDQLKERYQDENWQEHRMPAEFEALTKKEHASYFMYVRYGQKFPSKWIEECKRANAIPHIAWEPHDLKSVKNDAYLRSWGAALRAADWPVFIRFAGEMNGFWTPYHKDPKLYREKFRLVHGALHNMAPRVATIWCVNSIPLNNIDSYYPGDDGCDWVGINLYSVPFADNDPTRPTLLDSPVTLIDPIYKKYAARKPIAICEYAASHMAAFDRVRRNDLAINKMAQLYSSLPLLYPRIKMIDWFSMNTMRHAMPGRQLNNYNLTEQEDLRDYYTYLVQQPYFLGAPERLGDPRPPLPRPLVSGQKMKGMTKLALWVKTYVPRPKVYLKAGPKIVYAAKRPGAHRIDLDTSRLTPGRQILTAYIYDDKNRFITSRETAITVVR
ncbi:MAG TPA: hypothetical protein VF719_04150, partial [Abditibacteriaceae bacterium]